MLELLGISDNLNEKIVTQGVYANTTKTRTYNDEDGILDSENADGYNAYASTGLLGETETDGILAYVMIGVDPTFVTSITSFNYRMHLVDWSNIPLVPAMEILDLPLMNCVILCPHEMYNSSNLNHGRIPSRHN